MLWAWGVYGVKRTYLTYENIKHVYRLPEGYKGKGQAFTIVCNHLGYLDILALLCYFRGAFVAKEFIKVFFFFFFAQESIKKTQKVPWVGTISIAAKSLFVKSGSSLTSHLIERVQYAQHFHENNDCEGSDNSSPLFSAFATFHAEPFYTRR